MEENIEDTPQSYNIKYDNELKDFLRNLDSHIMGESIPFANITPNNTSIPIWINNIKTDYPQVDLRDIDDLLNTFRESLNSSSKQSKYNVCLLILKNTIILYHNNDLKNLTNFQTIFRAGIIKKVNNRVIFSAYEKNRKWSKGHANFWGIQLENVEWSNLSDIILTIKLEDFKYPLQLPVENTQIKDMILEENIKSNGTIQLGQETGEIQKINLYGKELTFQEFYEYYINETQELNKHTEFYNTLIPSTPTLDNYTHKETGKKYIEDKNYIYTNKTTIENRIHTKKHNQYTLTFISDKYPGIKPSKDFLILISQAIFGETKLNLCHVGEKKSSQPVEIGNLKLYNQLNLDIDFISANNYLLNLIKECKDETLKLLLKKYYCTYWINNLENNNIKLIFQNIINEILNEQIQKGFTNKKLDKEQFAIFESVDAVNSKPKKFANTIKKHVKNCIKKDKLLKYIILYGIEKKGQIKPINNYNSEHLPLLEQITNELLEKENLDVTVRIEEINVDESLIINIFILP